MKSKKLITTVCVVTPLIAMSCGKKSSAAEETTAEDSSATEVTSVAQVDNTVTTIDIANIDREKIKAYASTFKEIVKFMAGNFDEIPDGFWGIYAFKNEYNDGEGLTWAEVRNKVGFAFKDYDGDGKDELIIGAVENGEFKPHTTILALYNNLNGTPDLVLAGTGRSSWYDTADDGFFYMASEGAACSICGLYTLDKGSLQCYYYCFSTLNEEGDLNYYRSEKPTLNPEEAIPLDFTMDDFNSFESSHLDKAENIPLTPFAVFRPIEARQDNNKMHFIATADVTDFKILALSDPKFDNDYKLQFTEKVTESRDIVKAGEEIVVDMTINGDLPEHGISYTNPLGERVKMSVGISGFDGSVELSEY